MRKKTIVALMLALSIAQTGSVCTYAKTKDAYISGDEAEFSQEDLSETDYLLGYTMKDGCKYILEYGGRYYASEYREVDSSEGMQKYCDFTKGYATKEEAVKSAQAVPKNIMLSLDISAFSLKTLSDLSKVRFIIYEGTELKADTGLDKVNTIITDEETGDTDNSGSSGSNNNNKSDNGVSQDDEVDGKVKVSVKNRNIGNDFDVSNKLTVTWDLKESKASVFNISNEDYSVGLSNSKKGSKTISVDLANGSYNYEFITESGGVVTGTFKIANTFSDGGASGSSKGHRKNNVNIDEKAPKLKFSSIPKKVAFGQSFDLKIESDKDAVIRFNGQGSDSYKRKAKFTIWENGEYIYSARGKSGKETTGSIKVNCFKNEKYNRNGFWTGNTVGGNPASTIKKLVQTGMYDTKMLIASGILGISGVGILGYRLYKRRKEHGSNEKIS